MTTRQRTVRRPGANGLVPRRRTTAWEDTFINQDLANNARLDQDLLVNVSDADKRGLTVVRTLIHLWFTPAAGSVVNGSQKLFMGIQLSSEDAFAANAVPDPNNSTEYPIGGWMYRDLIVVINPNTGPFLNPSVELWRDIRSQRKLDRSEMMYSVENNAGSGTTFNVSAIGLIRVLYKLP